MDKKCVEDPCIRFSKFEYLIPFSAQKYGAYLINLYSESKKRNVERNPRWMECWNSQNIEVQSVQGKVNAILSVKVRHSGNQRHAREALCKAMVKACVKCVKCVL